MEVHQHSHTPRKKWTHYFWEFLMLFLAVFCGFLAEYKLEHTIEHQREKQYMKLMITDLQIDTLEIYSISNEIDTRLQKIDSFLQLLTVQPLTQESIIKSYYYTYPSLNNLTFKFNDRTITQLKKLRKYANYQEPGLLLKHGIMCLFFSYGMTMVMNFHKFYFNPGDILF